MLAPLISSLSITTRRLPCHGRAHLPRHPSQSTPLQRPNSFPLIQTRGHKTARRNRKALNIPPAPSFGGPPAVLTGGSGRSHRPRHAPQTPGDTIVFNPPSAAPNVYHTPSLFLPRDDPRRSLTLRTNAAGAAIYSSVARAPAAPSPSTAGASGLETSTNPSLPPALRQFPPRKYHLGPAQIEEMRRLRREDSATWTRAKLAEKFQCSNMFVMTVVRASEEWRQKERKRTEMQMRTWGPKRRKARADRERRWAAWTRGE